MRIMHVISSPAAGGAEVYVKDLAKRLTKHGHDLTIVFLGSAKDNGRSLSYEKNFLEELDNSGIGWEFIGNECRKKPWLGIKRIRALAKKHRVQVYHSHLPFGVIFGALLGCPKVYTHHSINPRLSWLTYRIFNQLIDRYVGISQVCAQRLRNYSGQDVTPILNGVDLEKFPKVDRSSVSNDGFVKAIVVGRIHPHKGYYFLAEAIEKLPAEARFRIQVSIAGEGDAEYTAQLKEFLEESGVSDNFTFLGNRSDVPRLMAEADIFLMSSEQEGLPISLIEATVSGLPCIVTDVGGCSEIIEICGNGVAVEYGDAEAYARELREVVESPEKLRRWSASAGLNCAQLDIESAAQKHLALYEELVGASG